MTISQYIENISDHFRKGIKTPAAADVDSDLVIDKKLINQISEKLKLAFIKDEGKGRTGEVCFANSPEVRPEFRLTFTTNDILDYVYAVIYSNEHKKDLGKYLKMDLEGIPIPSDTDIFWNLAALGKKLIKIHRLENPILEKEEALMRSSEIIKQIDQVRIGG